ncbi:MAG TPA: DUF4920 domain-containing protein [Thermoanaerobaculia bacterium]|nr:DUF4920 domain-containing protein [Thermoanaerobaculia bacterium]
MKKLAIVSLFLIAAAAFAGGEVVKRGTAIPADAKVVPLAQVLEKPDAYTKTAVVTEGHVEAACTKMGCWMQLAPEAGKTGVRITFKDYGFFVPKDSKGMSARVEGVVEIKTLSKDEADHLEHEGAKLARNEDGTAREVSFVADGVELRK